MTDGLRMRPDPSLGKLALQIIGIGTSLGKASTFCTIWASADYDVVPCDHHQGAGATSPALADLV